LGVDLLRQLNNKGINIIISIMYFIILIFNCDHIFSPKPNLSFLNLSRSKLNLKKTKLKIYMNWIPPIKSNFNPDI
jgi:hypothetical protein